MVKRNGAYIVNTGKLVLRVIFAFCASVASCTLAATAAVEVRPSEAKQGQTVSVIVSGSGTTAGAAAPEVNFNGRTFKTFAVPNEDGTGKNYRALICVPALIKPSTYKISAGDETTTLKVNAANFGVQRIRLPKSKDNFDGSPGERQKVDGAKQTVSDAQLWTGKFQYPCKARTSAAFGLRRAVNGKLLEDYFHSGVDFAAPTGTPVKATQKGKVIIAHTGWKLHGNTVAIDHGHGVVSFYIHLSKVNVKEGQMVEAGEKIGAVGATGRASGPHLHFSVYVNNDATNPGDWFAKGF